MQAHPRQDWKELIGVPGLLLAVSILAYGILVPRLGFAWDDLVAIWIRYELGPEAMQRCFTVSRPFLGWLFQATTSLLPPTPAVWHIFAIFWRWAGAVILWALIKQLWPGRFFLASSTALISLVYPGFSQQFVSYTYSHYFIILDLLLLSILFTVFAFRHPGKYWLWTIPAIILAGINLLTLEYFFTLELLRPFIIWHLVRKSGIKEQMMHTALKQSLPYLVIFLIITLGKLFLFPNHLYTIQSPAEWFSDPGTALILVLGSMGKSIWLAGGKAWASLFQFPSSREGVFPIYLIVTLAVGILCFVILLLINRPISRERFRVVLTDLAIVFLAILLAGCPFWLISFPFSLDFPSDRFTLPFLLGISLLFAQMLDYIPVAQLKLGLLAGMVGLAAGHQVNLADRYAQEWELQRSLFWQMSWRIPALESGTLVFLNDGAMDYYADNSMVGSLNWIYAPDQHSGTLDYLLFHPRSRLGGSLPALEPDIAISYDRYAVWFTGSTSNSLALEYMPPGCLRVLDPYLDPVNPAVEDTMQAAAALSNPDLILDEGIPILPDLYGPEPVHGWCYMYEKAELAYQKQDWNGILDIVQQAFSIGLYPADPDEWLIIIEAYAYTGRWNDARNTTVELSSYVPHMDPILRLLWQRINANSPDSDEKQTILDSLPGRLK